MVGGVIAPLGEIPITRADPLACLVEIPEMICICCFSPYGQIDTDSHTESNTNLGVWSSETRMVTGFVVLLWDSAHHHQYSSGLQRWGPFPFTRRASAGS